MPFCCVPLCKRSTSSDRTLSFYTFPQHPYFRKKWLQSIRRTDWTPTANSRVCSWHFPEGRERGPTRFEWTEGQLTDIDHQVKRKRQKVLGLVEDCCDDAIDEDLPIYEVDEADEVRQLKSKIAGLKGEMQILKMRTGLGLLDDIDAPTASSTKSRGAGGGNGTAAVSTVTRHTRKLSSKRAASKTSFNPSTLSLQQSDEPLSTVSSDVKPDISCGLQMLADVVSKTRRSRLTKDHTYSTTQINRFRLQGLTCAPLTPFTSTGELNLSVIGEYAQHLVDFGIQNLFVTGTTGEGNSLTVSERKQVAETWIKVGRGRFKAIVVHIGTGCLHDSKELAVHAQLIGADAIACVSPTYYKPETLDSYVCYMQNVASAAPSLPFYLYDIDFITGIKFGAVDFFDTALEHIPTLCGVKHTSPSFPSMHTLLARHGSRIQVLLGCDEAYLEGLAIGIDVNIIQSYQGLVLTRLKEAFDRNDIETARTEQVRALEVTNIVRKHGIAVSTFGKIVLKLLGLDCGQPRLPLAPFTDATVQTVKDELEKIGFFQWAITK